jgi:protein TonB
VNFVVERDGSITQAKVIKGIDPLLDAEALRVVNGMPKWLPGRQAGMVVAVKYTIPVTFRLQ